MQKTSPITKEAAACRKKFLYYFPGGFHNKKYYAWERDYKWDAHMRWENDLNKTEFKKLMDTKQFHEIANRAVKIETKTNLLFSFEKMALKDAVKPAEGAELFATGLYNYLHSGVFNQKIFDEFSNMLSSLPRKQTRVHTWPLQTIFGFIAKPQQHIFLKPRVTQAAANHYNVEFLYRSKPNWETYQSLIGFAEKVRTDNADLKPQDYIDLQSFIWVNGSDEYD